MATILEIANADRNLSALMKGLKAANLEESLSGAGPFTLFAPVNLAFGNLSAPDTFENIVKQSSSNSKLSDILTFHVISGKKLTRDLRDGQKLPTVNGKDLSVTVVNGEIRINGSKLLAKDKQGSNGVVHSLDTVNLPSK